MYDLIIIGGGPAGLSAGLYAARGQLKTLIMEKDAVGGQAVTTDKIENYPGAPNDTTGESLIERMREQCVEFGVEFISDRCESVEKIENEYVISGKKGQYQTKTIIIAAGASPMLLGVPGELEYRGMGVSYCATCDANFFRNRDVAVIGGGNTAVEEALYLTKFAEKVILIHRRDQLRADKILAERAFDNDKIEIRWNTVVDEITAKGLVNGLKVHDVHSGESSEIKIDGVFIFVGQKPNSDGFASLVHCDEKGYIITDENMLTNLPGIFAAGDIRKKSLRQVITAAADGAIAAVEAVKYIGESGV